MVGSPRSSAIALLAALLVLSGGVAVAPPTAAAAADGFVYLTSSTSPAQPTTSEEFTFTTTVRSATASDGPVEVLRVEIRDGGADATVLADRSFVGRPNPSIAPGGSHDENFSLSFDEPGVHALVVEVTFRSSSGDRAVATYDVDLAVYRPDPRIEMTAAPTAPGERTTLNVSIANGLEGDVRDVDLELDAEAVAFDETSRVASRVRGGATRSFRFGATPSSLGTHEIEATLAYTTAEGTRRRVTRTFDVGFREPDFEGDVGLAAEVAPAMPGAVTTLNLTVANGLDRAIRQIEVHVAAEGVDIRQQRRVGTGFESGAERTFAFVVNRSTSGRQPVDVTVSFVTADGVRGQVSDTLSTTFGPPANPGEITLTGVDAVDRGGRLEVSATAGNVGDGDVTAVVVSIDGTAAVAPADYFVGSVEGGDFASFTLSTAVTGNVSSVPVTVTYVVGGVERSFTTDVPVEQVVVREPDRGGLPWLPIAGLVVLLVAAALVYRRWR